MSKIREAYINNEILDIDENDPFTIFTAGYQSREVEIKQLREALETIIEYSSGMIDPVEVIAKEALKEKTNA